MDSVDRSYAPPASFTGTPSMRILAYLLSPPRMNSEVAPPYEPVCTIDSPATWRSASATVVIPSARSRSPLTTVTDDGVRPAAQRRTRRGDDDGRDARRIASGFLRAQGCARRAWQRRKGEPGDDGRSWSACAESLWRDDVRRASTGTKRNERGSADGGIARDDERPLVHGFEHARRASRRRACPRRRRGRGAAAPCDRRSARRG